VTPTSAKKCKQFIEFAITRTFGTHKHTHTHIYTHKRVMFVACCSNVKATQTRIYSSCFCIYLYGMYLTDTHHISVLIASVPHRPCTRTRTRNTKGSQWKWEAITTPFNVCTRHDARYAFIITNQL